MASVLLMCAFSSQAYQHCDEDGMRNFKTLSVAVKYAAANLTPGQRHRAADNAIAERDRLKKLLENEKRDREKGRGRNRGRGRGRGRSRGTNVIDVTGGDDNSPPDLSGEHNPSGGSQSTQAGAADQSGLSGKGGAPLLPGKGNVPPDQQAGMHGIGVAHANGVPVSCGDGVAFGASSGYLDMGGGVAGKGDAAYGKGGGKAAYDRDGVSFGYVLDTNGRIVGKGNLALAYCKGGGKPVYFGGDGVAYVAGRYADMDTSGSWSEGHAACCKGGGGKAAYGGCDGVAPSGAGDYVANLGMRGGRGGKGRWANAKGSGNAVCGDDDVGDRADCNVHVCSDVGSGHAAFGRGGGKAAVSGGNSEDVGYGSRVHVGMGGGRGHRGHVACGKGRGQMNVGGQGGMSHWDDGSDECWGSVPADGSGMHHACDVRDTGARVVPEQACVWPIWR